MRNNEEIRIKMEIYRIALIFSNWMCSIALIIYGFVLINSIGGLAFIIIIISVLLGTIGHFLINVALAIPFILLNNGDNLIAMAKKNDVFTASNDIWVCKKCSFNNRITALFCNSCGEKK
jgi:hypothetical protein